MAVPPEALDAAAARAAGAAGGDDARPHVPRAPRGPRQGRHLLAHAEPEVDERERVAQARLVQVDGVSPLPTILIMMIMMMIIMQGGTYLMMTIQAID